jgi:hypothetical protein
MKEDKEQDTLIMPRSFAVKAVLTEVHKVQWALFAASLKLTESESIITILLTAFMLMRCGFSFQKKQLRIY